MILQSSSGIAIFDKTNSICSLHSVVKCFNFVDCFVGAFRLCAIDSFTLLGITKIRILSISIPVDTIRVI